MQQYWLRVFLSYSILIPAIAAIMRYKVVLKDYRPFLWLIWLGLLNETVSILFIYSIRSNTVNSNIYVLLEYGLILLQFYKWNSSRAGKYLVMALVGLVVWFADNFLANSITQNNSLFRVFYSFMTVFFCIDLLNRILVFDMSPLLKNAMFLIAITFLVYYGFKAFVESFNVLHLGLNKNLLKMLWKILYFVNVFANLSYTAAILWIPTKQKFIMFY